MTQQQPREILLTGSFPLRPASKVFAAVSAHLGPLVRRIPDGEQNGWILAVFASHKRNPALEVAGQVAIDANGRNPYDFYRLKPGVNLRDLKLGPYGIAENALRSYEQFKELRKQGRIKPGVRMQVTMPGPGTTVVLINMPAEDIFPIARQALNGEIDQILKSIPPEDLTIHLDIAMEAEHEEYLRRPEAYDAPIHKVFHWTLDQMTESVAMVAHRVPSEVEFGMHICSAWHHDPDAGQDNQVLVDIANGLSARIKRPIGYIHIPLVPEHDDGAMTPFKELHLHPETKLFLGVIHLTHGVEGAARLIKSAAKIVPDFGVAGFCGMGQLPRNQGDFTYEPPPVSQRRVSARDLGTEATLDMHRAVAEVAV